MPKINNVEFLTLPQQVSKNKRDIQDNVSNIASLNQAVQNINVGIANIPMLSGITIDALGVPHPLSGTNKALLLENLKKQAAIKDDDKTISWAIHMKVMGSLVGDSAFPQSLVDYDINLSNITFAGYDNNRFYRVRGFSRDFTFVIECNVDTTKSVWTYMVDPTITMSSILQPSVYYTNPGNIVGGVVAIADLSPTDHWVKAGDMVIAGSGIYSIDSVVGTNVNVSTQTGFVAPTGTIRTWGSRGGTGLTEVIKININSALGVKLFDTSESGISFEEQVNALGLDFTQGMFIRTQYIGNSIASATFKFPVNGMLAVGIKNNTDADINVGSLLPMEAYDSDQTQGVIYQSRENVNLTSNPINFAWAGFDKISWSQFEGVLPTLLSNKTINPGKAYVYLFKF